MKVVIYKDERYPDYGIIEHRGGNQHFGKVVEMKQEDQEFVDAAMTIYGKAQELLESYYG